MTRFRNSRVQSMVVGIACVIIGGFFLLVGGLWLYAKIQGPIPSSQINSYELSGKYVILQQVENLRYGDIPRYRVMIDAQFADGVHKVYYNVDEEEEIVLRATVAMGGSIASEQTGATSLMDNGSIVFYEGSIGTAMGRHSGQSGMIMLGIGTFTTGLGLMFLISALRLKLEEKYRPIEDYPQYEEVFANPPAFENVWLWDHYLIILEDKKVIRYNYQNIVWLYAREKKTEGIPIYIIGLGDREGNHKEIIMDTSYTAGYIMMILAGIIQNFVPGYSEDIYDEYLGNPEDFLGKTYNPAVNIPKCYDFARDYKEIYEEIAEINRNNTKYKKKLRARAVVMCGGIIFILGILLVFIINL